MSLPNSLEDRRLLNPAFTGVLLVRASQSFWKQAQAGLPYVYAHLVLPLVLHPETRERLPHAIVTKLVTWSERNGELLAPLPRRTNEFTPATREGLFVATSTGLARLGPSAEIEPLIPERLLIAFERQVASLEVAECVKKANFLGRWFAASGTVPTILTALGVRL
jgi:hypothetical protein